MKFPGTIQTLVVTSLVAGAMSSSLHAEPLQAVGADGWATSFESAEENAPQVRSAPVVQQAQARTGEASVRFGDSADRGRVTIRGVPTDWSAKASLSFWLHSEVANGQQLMVAVFSDDPTQQGPHYFFRQIPINFSGWQQIVLPFSSFSSARSPVGWNQVDSIVLATSEWELTQLPDTVLHLDDLSVD